MSYISSSNFRKVSSVISPLSRIFAPFGFAECLGCTLAQGGKRERCSQNLRTYGESLFESAFACNQSGR